MEVKMVKTVKEHENINLHIKKKTLYGVLRGAFILLIILFILFSGYSMIIAYNVYLFLDSSKESSLYFINQIGMVLSFFVFLFGALFLVSCFINGFGAD
jgi:hypothetical protein